MCCISDALLDALSGAVLILDSALCLLSCRRFDWSSSRAFSMLQNILPLHGSHFCLFLDLYNLQISKGSMIWSLLYFIHVCSPMTLSLSFLISFSPSLSLSGFSLLGLGLSSLLKIELFPRRHLALW